MLRTHGRYDYSNITKRPDYSWPGGKRLAVYVAINIEQFSYGEGKGAAIAPPDQANSHSIFSWRDYGNRVGVWRLFDLFDSLDIPIEAQINTAIYDHCPDIVDRLRQRGDEILGHGITNSEEQGGLSEAEEAEFIRTVTETLTRQEGQPTVGWMSPWLSNSEVTTDLLQEAGYRYCMDWTSDDQPIWTYDPSILTPSAEEVGQVHKALQAYGVDMMSRMSGVTSSEHSDEDIDFTVAAFEKAVAELLDLGVVRRRFS